MNIDLFGIEDTLTLQKMDVVIAEFEAKLRYVRSIRDRCADFSIKQDEKLLLYRDFLAYLSRVNFSFRVWSPQGTTEVGCK